MILLWETIKTALCIKSFPDKFFFFFLQKSTECNIFDKTKMHFTPGLHRTRQERRATTNNIRNTLETIIIFNFVHTGRGAKCRQRTSCVSRCVVLRHVRCRHGVIVTRNITFIHSVKQVQPKNKCQMFPACILTYKNIFKSK